MSSCYWLKNYGLILRNMGILTIAVNLFEHKIYYLFVLLIRNPLHHLAKNILGVNVTDWPAFEAFDKKSIKTKIMELNPYNFGHLYNDPYRYNCDELWKQYFD